MAKARVIVEKVVLNTEGVKAFLASPELRQVLEPGAQAIYDAIPASDGIPYAPRRKGEKQVNGRYERKTMDKEAFANDGRVAIQVGVESADRGFFRLQTIQKAVRSAGAKMRRKRKKV